MASQRGRQRSRREHLGIRDRSVDLRSQGRFALQLPQIGITFDGGANWREHPWQMEVSGFHHNVFGGFLSLRPALFSAGPGEVVARNFSYHGETR